MEAAYGLSITITMLMTTALLTVYLNQKKVPVYITGLLLAVYLTIEGSFLVANLNKFVNGGWFTILLGGILFTIMYTWYKGRKIKNNFSEFVKIENYVDIIKALHDDQSVQKFATNLAFITKANTITDLEEKIIYSILKKQPKRADVYWLLHVDIMDDPHRLDYRITPIIEGILIKIDFRIGFKVQPRVNLFFRYVVEEMKKNGEIDPVSRYDSLRKHNINADFRFVIIDRIQNYDFDFKPWDQLIMDLYMIIKRFGIGEVKALGLDNSNTTTETVPLHMGKEFPFNL
jgi:KUP system potassium uptake protein